VSSANLAIGPKSSYLYFPVFFRGFIMVFQLVPLGSGHVGRAAASARGTIVNESSLQFMGTVLGEVVEPKQSRSDRTLADDVAWFVPAPKTLSRWSGNARARGRSCRSSRSFWRCKMQNSLISRVRSPGRQGDRTRTLPLAHKVERAIL